MRTYSLVINLDNAGNDNIVFTTEHDLTITEDNFDEIYQTLIKKFEIGFNSDEDSYDSIELFDITNTIIHNVKF